MATVRVLILRAPGANCDGETQFAFELAGAQPERIHVNRVRERPALLDDFQVLVVPGGFTYGDDVAAGKVLAVELQHFLGDALGRFRDAGKLILGVCNGFQALLKSGFLLPPDDKGPVATLAHNERGRFEDRWIYLQARPGRCPFLNGVSRMHLPIAHGEGRFLCREESLLQRLDAAGQIVLRYCDAEGRPGRYPINPNGAQGDVAGICDTTGRVFCLMPHPERHVLPTQHPRWSRVGLAPQGDGLVLFRNAVQYFS
jgi:phosphoribosylformylglycinamidine synthase